MTKLPTGFDFYPMTTSLGSQLLNVLWKTQTYDLLLYNRPTTRGMLYGVYQFINGNVQLQQEQHIWITLTFALFAKASTPNQLNLEFHLLLYTSLVAQPSFQPKCRLPLETQLVSSTLPMLNYKTTPNFMEVIKDCFPSLGVVTH